VKKAGFGGLLAKILYMSRHSGQTVDWPRPVKAYPPVLCVLVELKTPAAPGKNISLISRHLGKLNPTFFAG
jgi:hypothetical protein